MCDREAVMAGAVRQSTEGGEGCPECGADLVSETLHDLHYACGSSKSVLRTNLRPELGDTESENCLRRQLAQAQDEIKHLNWITDEMQKANHNYAERNGRLWAENIRLRRVVEGISQLADAQANPYLAAIAALRELVTLHDETRHTDPDDYERRKPAAWEAAREALRSVGPLAIIADAPEIPYSSVVEAARNDYNSARTACDYRRGQGVCEAWTNRGRECSDCPMEWFCALVDAFAKLDGNGDQS